MSSQGTFPITEAQLVALFMQSAAYGVHVTTFAMCMYTWVELRNTYRTSRSWPWVAVATILFFIGTVDVSFNLYHNLLAFVIQDGGQDAQGEFEDLSGWVDVMRVSTVSSARHHVSHVVNLQSVWARLSVMVSDVALVRVFAIFSAELTPYRYPVAGSSTQTTNSGGSLSQSHHCYGLGQPLVPSWTSCSSPPFTYLPPYHPRRS